jgi:hypothetical protein
MGPGLPAWEALRWRPICLTDSLPRPAITQRLTGALILATFEAVDSLPGEQPTGPRPGRPVIWALYEHQGANSPRLDKVFQTELSLRLSDRAGDDLTLGLTPR